MKIKFEFEKETKNTIRYSEKTEGTPPVVRTIYLQKWLFKNNIYPKEIEITLEWK